MEGENLASLKRHYYLQVEGTNHSVQRRIFFEGTKMKDSRTNSARAQRIILVYFYKGGRGARPAPGLAGDRRRARARARARAKYEAKIKNITETRLFSRITYFSMLTKVIQFFILYKTPLSKKS